VCYRQRFGLRLTHRRCSVIFSRGSGRPGLWDRFGLLRNRTFHAFWPAEQVLAEMRAFDPQVIRGYPSALSSLADQLSEEDKRRIRPRFITTDSENLTAMARERIEQGFQAPVFDVYDCFECNVIAYQCPRGGQYHVLDTSIVAEVLNGDQPALPGERGEIAITSLHTWAAPLIRYMPGDLVQQGASHCSCGAPNSCLAQVYGRTQDRFILADQRKNIHPGLFALWLYPICPVLRRYQIVQEAIDRFVVKLQPSPGVQLPAEKVEAMRQKMARDLGEGVTLRVDLVDDIPSEPNGKFRPYRCEVEVRR
jgi:phenylacetate-CoA ligase